MPIYTDQSGKRFYVGGSGVVTPSAQETRVSPDKESVVERYQKVRNEPLYAYRRYGQEIAGLSPAIMQALQAAGAPAQGILDVTQPATEAQAGYQQAGLGSLEAQQALAGLLGPEAQQAAIAQLEGSPQFQALAAQGEQAILANAAATGGVRGGNTQAALAQFRPALLSQLINEQYGRLAGISGMGAQAGQGLVSAGLGAAGIAADVGVRGAGMQAELGREIAQAGLYGSLGQTQLEMDREAQRRNQALAQGADIAKSAVTGAGTGATIGAGIGAAAGGIGAVPGALIGAGIGGLGGALLSGMSGQLSKGV